MGRFNFASNQPTYDELLRAYSENHRYYHNIHHIQFCLAALDSSLASGAFTPAPGPELELALWFHDAIYQPFSKDNELNSANWAKSFLQKNNASRDVINEVDNLIMASCHQSSLVSENSALMVDIDLAILGAEPAVFDEYNTNVRREYKRVPALIYNKKRRKILESFLNRESIYSTKTFYKQYELTARENIHRAISEL